MKRLLVATALLVGSVQYSPAQTYQYLPTYDLSNDTITPTGGVSTTMPAIAATANSAMQPAKNLLDLANPATARTNLGVDTPANRPPTVMDDSTVGYKVGDIWSYKGKIWQAQQVGAGAATWLPVNVGQARPLDLAPTAVGAYGTVLLNSAYAGSDLILTRGSDSTTKTIGFVNGAVDAATADAFCVTNGDLAAGTCYVTTLYDQSGNPNNATAPAGISAPLWTTNTVNGYRAITFNSVQSGASPNPRYMTIPTTASFTQMNASLFAIAQTRSTAMNGAFASVGSTIFYNAASAVNKVGVTINAGIGTSPVGGQTGPAVTLMAQFAGTAAYYVGNSVETGVATGQPAATVTGGTLGTSGGSGTMDAVALVLYNRSLSAADTLELRASGEMILRAAPQTQDIWVADGDSITNGYGSTFLQGYPRQGGELLSRSMTRYNVGMYGTTLVSQMPRFGAFYTPIYQPNARNFIVSVAICTNDLGGGVTGAACFANLKTYVAQIKALGRNVRVIVATLLPRSGAYSTEAIAFNNLLRGGWNGFADGLADLAADPVMGLAANSNGATAYYADGLHPTDLGYSYLAPIVANAVNNLLK